MSSKTPLNVKPRKSEKDWVNNLPKHAAKCMLCIAAGYDEQQPSAGDHLRWFTAKEQK
jgi:hypothetical protein